VEESSSYVGGTGYSGNGQELQRAVTGEGWWISGESSGGGGGGAITVQDSYIVKRSRRMVNFGGGRYSGEIRLIYRTLNPIFSFWRGGQDLRHQTTGRCRRSGVECWYRWKTGNTGGGAGAGRKQVVQESSF
jgi:hypothetical protein